ncbi:hypothetical protein BD414DRAFT_476364 [Trametes punicea]|nr:hypothetical protein BD414DRAFT_476364 [Trametes punicea]
MPRRSPPTPLRLHTGPLPPRGQPKHTLPSLPRPAFHGPTPSAHSGPVPRARMAHTDLPALVIPEPTTVPGLPGVCGGPLETAGAGGMSSPTSAGSVSTSTLMSGGGRSSLESGRRRKRSRECVRGPWDHSGAIQVPFDVGAVLPPPKPVAVNLR